ncbi:hypothetical protein DNTS_021084 [Danionella cerebrum]|uniref:Sine oculis-binding protein homolog n=1 Tax=Danionella cerebrum TaxID=2873325 RepID=A0A553R9E3_9TELE|nr:hypothetical protein DNTS_021084 [Danionella translucida]
MAEMEKEGRPPENKRSRKPAHPVKREINAEMKTQGYRTRDCTQSGLVENPYTSRGEASDSVAFISVCSVRDARVNSFEESMTSSKLFSAKDKPVTLHTSQVPSSRTLPGTGQAGNLHGNSPYLMSFAENTMNELLGWYGYDKVELRDSDDIEIRNYPDGEMRQHISVLKENSLPKASVVENIGGSPPHANCSGSAPASRTGGTVEASGNPSSASSSKEHGGLPIIVPLIPPPLIKAPSEEDGSNVQIMCAWCQKVGVKRYSLSMGSELKSFCSEKCFAACRRAYFKRNKAREEEGIPQHTVAKETPRLVLKTNSDVLVCDWCKHIRHTKEYLDFGAGERRLQFCSAKCLNQYKMDIFYKETQAALPGGLCNPPIPTSEAKSEIGSGVQLLTPESWSAPLNELRSRKPPSPGGAITGAGPPGSASGSPSETGTVCSSSSSTSSSSSSTKIPTPRPHESPVLGPPHPPPMAGLHPGLGVPPGNPPMVMTPRGPIPLPVFMEHQMMQHIRPPFLRPPGPNSPHSNPMIPGIGPPPPRTLGPPSSPMHRPLLSPHIHPSSTPNLTGNPPILPPHHASHIPGLPFHPVNMMPPGPIPVPPIMNIGMPSLAPLVPPPTLLVPYPVIVPLPVPIPIPVPIPFNPQAPSDRSGNVGTLSSSETEEKDSRAPPFSSRGEGRDLQKVPPTSDTLSPEFSKQTEEGTSNGSGPIVKMENSGNGNSDHSLNYPPADEVIDLTTNHRSRLVIKKALPCVQVKSEPGLSPPPALLDETEVGVSASTSTTTIEDYHRDSNAESSFASLALPCPDPSYCSGTPPISQPTSSSATNHTCSITTAKKELGSSAPCNVIVNGSCNVPPTESLIRTSPLEQRPLLESSRRTATLGTDLEGEDLKENSCLTTERDLGGKRSSSDQPAINAGTGEDKAQSPEDQPSGEDHAYAIPLMPKPGCVIQPVPKPADKTAAILPCGLTAPLAGTVPMEMEPPLKRRCLRIRNQNK